MKKLLKTLSASLFFFPIGAYADPIAVGDLVIEGTIARATVPGQKVGGGYMTITNNGSETERLVGAMASFSGKAEIHQMKMENDVMKMSALPEGLEIPAGETVTLKPGGYHVMFMKLGEPLKAGEERNATLVFEKAGKVNVTFNVMSIEDTMKMNDDKMDHSSHGAAKKEGE